MFYKAFLHSVKVFKVMFTITIQKSPHPTEEWKYI